MIRESLYDEITALNFMGYQVYEMYVNESNQLYVSISNTYDIRRFADGFVVRFDSASYDIIVSETDSLEDQIQSFKRWVEYLRKE